MTNKHWTCDSCGTENVIENIEHVPEGMFFGCTGCSIGQSIGLTPDKIKIGRALDREKIYRIDESLRALNQYAEEFLETDEARERIHNSVDEMLTWLPDFKNDKT